LCLIFLSLYFLSTIQFFISKGWGKFWFLLSVWWIKIMSFLTDCSINFPLLKKWKIQFPGCTPQWNVLCMLVILWFLIYPHVILLL
jgi:hypothetical protein